MLAEILMVQALLILFISGILYGFSDFIMRALNNIPSHSAIEAMNSINVSVYKSLFMVFFMLLTISSVGIVIASITIYGWSASLTVLVAGILYVLGMFVVTGKGNVPLNEALKSSTNSTSDSNRIWKKYYRQWTRLNTVRCIFGVLSSLLFLFAANSINL